MDDGRKEYSPSKSKMAPDDSIRAGKSSEDGKLASVPESDDKRRRAMKTVTENLAVTRPLPQSSLDSGDEPPSPGAPVSPGADSTRSSHSSNLMEQFMTDMDLVFSEILAEEDMKSFRHGMHMTAASDTSSQFEELALTLTLDDVTSPHDDAAASDASSSDQKSKSTTMTSSFRKKRPRNVVPLAVLEEFSEGSSSRDVWSTDDMMSESHHGDTGHGVRSSSSSDSDVSDDDGEGETEGAPINARAKRTTFRKSRPRKNVSINGPMSNAMCVVDMNSNAKERTCVAPTSYEDLERVVLSDDERDGDDDDDEDVACDGDAVVVDDSPMLQFAEKYFNVHVIHMNYPNAITKTVNIVTRKTLNEVVPVEDLIRFTKNSSIFTSHVRFLDADGITFACSMFKDIHRWMRGDTKLDASHSIIRGMISHCLQHKELRDELICQVIRLMTDNPNEDMVLRLWPLLGLACVAFSPSLTLRKYLVRHLHRVVYDEEKKNESKCLIYAKYCLHLVRKKRYHTRRFSPSAAEIETMQGLQPLVYRIHFLDGKTKAIALDASETASDAISRVAEKIGLQNTYGWALYESIPEHDRYVKNHEYLADILSDWEEKQKIITTVGTPKKGSPKTLTTQSYGKLVLCKRFCQRVCEISDDVIELRLLYAQAVHYVIHLDEFQAPLSIALHLAGLQAQADYGNYDETKQSRYAEPEEMLCQRHLFSDSKEWSQELEAAHKRYGKGKTMSEAMKKYLTVVSQFPLYGCTKVFAHYRGVWPYGIETVMAVNYDGVKLISIQEKKITFDLSYSEIEEIVLQERHGECHVIVLLKNTVSQIRQKTFLFECLELDDLAELVASYSPKHATWLNQPGKKKWKKYEFPPSDDWHRIYDNILKCRQMLVQTGTVKHPPHEEVGFLRSAFNRLSGRNCSSSSRNDHDLEMEDFNEMSLGSHWAFTKVPFKTSLLGGQTHETEDVAVRMFNSTLVYTGLELSAALDDMDLVVVVQTLITKCMENENLCNEFYLQLMKQTTDAKTCGPEHKVKNPLLLESNMKAMNQYWHLMTMASCVMLPPNNIVFAYLNLHLRRCCMLSHLEEGKFAQFCLKSLHRTFENHGRKYPPSYKEILFVTKRQPIEGRVYLADGHPMLIEFDSAATAAEVIEIIKAKSGLRLDADGFALFQCIGDREEHIAGETKLADCLYQWEKSSRINHTCAKDFKLLFKKRMFFEPFMNVKDPVEIDLLYNQSVTDVFEQKIPLTKSDAVHLCALRAQAEYGDYGHSNTIDYNSVVRILPRHLRDLMVLSEISSIHHTLVGTSPLVANIAFLEILKQWPLYGAVLYEVSHSCLDYLPKTLWLAVSQLGLHLMEFKGQTIYSTYSFDELSECSPTNKMLTITVSNENRTLTLVFFTSEGHQIVQLINDYREVLAQRRKTTEEMNHLVDAILPEDASLADILKSSSGQQCDRSLGHRGEKTLKLTSKHRGEGDTTLRPVVRLAVDEGGHGGLSAHPESPKSSPERRDDITGGLIPKTQSKNSTHGYQRMKEGSRHSSKQSMFRVEAGGGGGGGGRVVETKMEEKID